MLESTRGESDPVVCSPPEVPIESGSADTESSDPVDVAVGIQTKQTRTFAPIDEWSTLLARLNLSGMVRALAQNCELVSIDDERIELRLSPVHRHLLTRASQDRMQQAMADETGVSRTLHIALAETRGETPAAQSDRARKAERESAIGAIETDPAVREMIELLDATVIDSTISVVADTGPTGTR